jgi:hypothetical protein
MYLRLTMGGLALLGVPTDWTLNDQLIVMGHGGAVAGESMLGTGFKIPDSAGNGRGTYKVTFRPAGQDPVTATIYIAC